MLLSWTAWFREHVYLAVLLATTLEGLGFPLPAEALFLAAGAFVHRGTVSLPALIAVACGGNMLGSLTGFGVAYAGGFKLIHSVFRMVGVKAEAVGKVRDFFNKYGPTTVFISRFVGFIRAATIYTAGASRMSPWRFALYLGVASVIWNGAWVWLAFTFGQALPGLMHRTLGRGAVWLVGVLALFLVVRSVIRWYKRRKSS